MLKLLKYEWKACARICLPTYGAIILLAFCNRILNTVNAFDTDRLAIFDFLRMIAVAAYAGVIMLAFGVTVVILIQRFYKNLLGDEGYLMLTLPVTISQHIASKALVALVMCILSGITTLLSVFILNSHIDDFNIVTFWGEETNFLHILELFFFGMLCILCAILFAYFCISLGHLAKKHRIVMAIVWYFVLSNAAQIIMVMFLSSPIGDMFFEGLDNIINPLPPVAQIHIMLLSFCAIVAAVSAALFFGIRYILTNRLNLE